MTIWTPKAVSYNRQRKDAKCLKHAVAALKPEETIQSQAEPDPRQPNGDEDGYKFTCRECLSSTNRVLSEVCCGAESLLGKISLKLPGCTVVRITESDEFTTRRT